jgi:hypothetical protein
MVVYNGLEICPSPLETVDLRGHTRNLRDFTLMPVQNVIIIFLPDAYSVDYTKLPHILSAVDVNVFKCELNWLQLMYF